MNHNQVRRIQDTNRTTPASPTPSHAHRLAVLLFLLLSLVGHPLRGAAATGVGEKTKEIVRETSAAVEQAGGAAAEAAKDLWQRIDEARLSNRTPDELVAWIIVGVLVGAVAGMMTTLKPTGLGKIGRLLLGLAGAFLGGIVVHVGQFNFGWGPVLIRYEELFFSFIGAILILIVGKIVHARMTRKSPPK